MVSTTEGSPAKLEIRLCSDPKPRLVAWEWGTTRLHAGEVLETRYRAHDLEPLSSEDCYIAILEFTHTSKEDQRLYYVIVENDHGSDRRALMLRVDEPAQVNNNNKKHKKFNCSRTKINELHKWIIVYISSLRYRLLSEPLLVSPSSQFLSWASFASFVPIDAAYPETTDRPYNKYIGNSTILIHLLKSLILFL